MAISQVDIVNIALTRLGQKTITSMSESNEGARRASIVYNTSLDSVLRAHDWNFASMTEAMAEISGEVLVGWDYLYTYPTKCLFVRKVFEDATTSSPAACEFKEVISPTTKIKSIAAKISPAYVEYTYRVVDPNQYDTAFIEAFTFKLAGELAQPLTGNKELGVTMFSMYRSIIEEAKRSNRSESNVTPTKTSSYIDAR